MAQADVSSYAPSHSNLHTPPVKRNRLSLRRSTQFLRKPCYKEDDSSDVKPDIKPEDVLPIEMVDLSQDENLSPNVKAEKNIESKTEPVFVDNTMSEENVKVWSLGLPNCGNTCFANSVLQVLRYTPDFIKNLHAMLVSHHQLSKFYYEQDTKETLYFKNIHLLYSAMKKKEVLMRINVEKDYSPFLSKPVLTVINSLREISALFEEGEQHDAHEFFITTLSAYGSLLQSLKRMSEEIAAEESQQPSSSSEQTPSPPPTKRLRKAATVGNLPDVHSALDMGFEGRICHIVQCIECEKTVEREESFANLEVNIPQSANTDDLVNLQDCLSQETMLSGDNKYFCENCLHYNEAKMTSEVVTLPPILLLHFSWTRVLNEASHIEKTSLKMVIPTLLETSGEDMEIFRRCGSQPSRYALYAMILHIGKSTEDGHYVAVVRDTSVDEKCVGGATKSPANTSWWNCVNADACCSTEGIARCREVRPNKWLLFDDGIVSQVVIDDDSDTFPYYDYLSTTASPCLIFYHRT